VAPGAAAYMVTERLSHMLIWAAVFAVAGAISGYWVSHWLDASIAGCIAVMLGVIFGTVLCFAPRRGLLSMAARRRQQKVSFATSMLAIHLLHHEDLPSADRENSIAHLG